MTVLFQADMPIPPSANEMNRHTRVGPRRTPRYRKWLVEAGWTIRASGVLRGHKTIEGGFKVILTFNRLMTKADLDNLYKPVLDLMQDLRVISNDRNQIDTGGGWGEAPLGCRIAIVTKTEPTNVASADDRATEAERPLQRGAEAPDERGAPEGTIEGAEY